MANMDLLTQQIDASLASKSHCTITHEELVKVFPEDERAKAERYAAILAYAQSQGWTAAICDPGVRVTFSKAEG